MNAKNKRGITLIEVLIACLVFTIALAALLGSIASMIDIIELSREKTTASYHLKNMLERIKATAFDSIITDFPNGTVNGPSSNPYQNIVGGYTLSSEHIMVTYPNTTTDPLEVCTQLLWQNKKGYNISANLTTFRTR